MFGEDSNLENVINQEINEFRKQRDTNKAIQERNKAIKERESIRSLCNELRSQRDLANSKLAEVLREKVEMTKQRLSDLKQISFLEYEHFLL